MSRSVALVCSLCLLTVIAGSADTNTSRYRDYWPTIEWRVATPESKGFDSKKLDDLSTILKEELVNATSLLVSRHGYIVYEYYAYNDPQELRDLWSISKSVLSALIGVALQKEYLQSIEMPISGFFPEYTANRNAKEISIRHLLTMSSGITSNEDDSQIRSDIFSRELRNKPGTEFFYNNVGPQLLSMILEKASGTSAHNFAKNEIFSRIGISHTEWSTNRIGGVSYSEGGFGLRMTTRDLARFGYLYLNNGTWDMEQIIPSSWVSISTIRQISVSESSWYFTREYGFFWWLRAIENLASYVGIGYMGQFLCIIPDYDIVVVITAQDVGKESLYLRLVDTHIVPAIIEQ